MIGVRFPVGLSVLFFATASRPTFGPTQPPINGYQGALSPGVKRPGGEANNSSPSSSKLKNACSYAFTSPYVFMAWCLMKYRDNFTFVPFKYPRSSAVCTLYAN
jgi:hypothetical protein